jgi:hypothetical protein
LEGFHNDAVLLEKPFDQKNRPDRDKNILTEENRDVIDGAGLRAHTLAHGFGEGSQFCLCGGFGHRSDQGPHQGCRSSHRGQSQRRTDLTDEKIQHEQTEERHRPKAGNEVANPLLKPGPFQGADGGKDQPHHADIAVLVERLAEGRNDAGQIEPSGQPAYDGRGHHDQKRIDPRHESEDHDGDAQQRPHESPIHDSPAGQ